jgi:LemA protein
VNRLAAPSRPRGTAVYALGAAAVCAAAVAIWAAVTYNALVQARVDVDTQWSQVEIQYQRRVDLVPSLVAALRGYLVQERTVLAAVAEARTAYLGSPAGSTARVHAASQLEQGLGRLVAVVEASPTLRSNETVAGLMDELAGTENRIAVERRRYNDRVLAYNTRVLTLPSSVVASLGGFRPREYFAAAPGAETAPSVTLPPP